MKDKIGWIWAIILFSLCGGKNVLSTGQSPIGLVALRAYGFVFRQACVHTQKAVLSWQRNQAAIISESDR